MARNGSNSETLERSWKMCEELEDNHSNVPSQRDNWMGGGNQILNPGWISKAIAKLEACQQEERLLASVVDMMDIISEAENNLKQSQEQLEKRVHGENRRTEKNKFQNYNPIANFQLTNVGARVIENAKREKQADQREKNKEDWIEFSSEIKLFLRIDEKEENKRSTRRSEINAPISQKEYWTRAGLPGVALSPTTLRRLHPVHSALAVPVCGPH
ncbi:hypothetical protein C8R44DRAFT_738976 [Mycena epipterygia]|nr:hypothetical protein C8R44DRAFT_738976 [Mycena epipterygia]